MRGGRNTLPVVRDPLSEENFSATGVQSAVLQLVDIQRHHFTLLQALQHYEIELLERHAGDAAMVRDVRLQVRTVRLELERHSSLSALAMCEARVRLDYQKRCRKRFKDAVSRALRNLHQTRGQRVRWDELLDVWKIHQLEPANRRVVGELKSAYHYRHWLAHGRYWPLPQTFTYGQVYRVVEAFLGITGLS